MLNSNSFFVPEAAVFRMAKLDRLFCKNFIYNINILRYNPKQVYICGYPQKFWSIIHFSSRPLEPSMKYSLVEDHCDKTFVPNFAQNKNIILPVQFAFPID